MREARTLQEVEAEAMLIAKLRKNESGKDAPVLACTEKIYHNAGSSRSEFYSFLIPNCCACSIPAFLEALQSILGALAVRCE